MYNEYNQEIEDLRRKTQLELKVRLKDKHLRKLLAIRKRKELGIDDEKPSRRTKEIVNTRLYLKKIDPLTRNQSTTFDSFRGSNKHILLHGLAGTGKSFLALGLALEEVLTDDSDYDKVLIIRSIVASRDPGFLPGSMKEKQRQYEMPYQTICTKLFGRGDAYDILTKRGKLEFTTTSFLRGETFENTIVIVDEIQNMTFHELDTIITRIGENCRILLCGDYIQSDLDRMEKDKDRSGIQKFIRVVDNMKSFDHIEFGIDDIVRSKVVKEYILAKKFLGY